MKKLKICIAGLGNVGSSVVNLIEKNSSLISERILTPLGRAHDRGAKSLLISPRLTDIPNHVIHKANITADNPITGRSVLNSMPCDVNSGTVEPGSNSEEPTSSFGIVLVPFLRPSPGMECEVLMERPLQLRRAVLHSN